MYVTTIWNGVTATRRLEDVVLLESAWDRIDAYYTKLPARRPVYWHVESFNTGKCASVRMNREEWAFYCTTRRYWAGWVNRHMGDICDPRGYVQHVSPMERRKVGDTKHMLLADLFA